MHSSSYEAPTHDAGGTVNNRPAFGVSMGTKNLRGFALLGVVTLLAGMIGFAPAQAQSVTPVGTAIQNTASVVYTPASGTPATINSNPVTAIVAPPLSRSVVTILRGVNTGATLTSTAGPTQCLSASGFVTLPAPVLTGGVSVDPLQPISLATTTNVHGGEAAFVQLDDADQNVDAASIDTTQLRLTTVAGDQETLRLSETGINTGIFVGYIQTRVSAVTAGNCLLEVALNATISSLYVDPADAGDSSRADALVDPFGLVFDSRSGAAINGARVRLINTASGAPASVLGDDGVSNYPSEVVTGQAVTDSGGTLYTLPAGVFRFPLVAPGNYRFEVTPPAGYAFPSTSSIAQLGATPGAPFRLNTGSFGNVFTVNAGPAIAVDLPLDTAATQLFMQKTTTTTVAAVGDFVQYHLSVENTSATTVLASVRAIDQLPNGVRYQRGSTRIGGQVGQVGQVGQDPQISSDGQTLTFTSGVLAARASLEIRYVVEVTAGARGKQLVNAAYALAPDNTSSNIAQVAIQLREELFRDRAIVMGRVVAGECATPAHQLPGIANVRVYLEDGRYVLTDEEGKYHFDDVMPGSHVVQLDTVTIPETHEVQLCGEQVRQAGRGYSQFVDLRGGALWRSDFVLKPKALPKGAVALQLRSALSGGQLSHSVVLDVTKLDIANTRVLVMLPEGLAYRAGSATLNANQHTTTGAEPAVSANVLTFDIGAVRADANPTLSFRTDALPGSSGVQALKAVAIFDTASAKQQRTAPVENTVLRGELLYEDGSYRFAPRFDVLDTTIAPADAKQLDKIVEEWRGMRDLTLKVVGHTDSTPIAAANRMAFADNEALSRARAAAVADYLVSRLGVARERVTIEGRGAAEPIATGTDPKSLGQNRRVEIALDGFRVVAAGGLTVKQDSARSATIETVGKFAQQAPLRTRSTGTKIGATIGATIGVDQRKFDVERLAPEFAWLTPDADAVPTIPSIKVAIAHTAATRVELLVNGKAVSPLNFDGVQLNGAKTAALSRWRGVDLRDGDNELTAILSDASGAELQRATRAVHFAGGGVRAELVREQSTLVADGRTHPVIALRMTDLEGKQARPGTLGAYQVEPPYRSWFEVESLNENPLTATRLTSTETREPTFSVDDDGLARLELEPTSQAGTAVLRLRFNERQQQEIRVWLEPQVRDWILVGIAEGTAAYKTISDNLQSAERAGLEDGYSHDGRVAFFAKGAIKGEFLLTAAYDSAREYDLEKDKLLSVVEPDRFYTLYGDVTEQRFEASTNRKLFLKLERRQFAALFGDFETGLTVTELSRYSRTFTGLKSDYAGEHFGYSAFAAESEQGYIKDELQGDGTSGLYRLSRRPLIVNSDKLRLEVRDRFRSEVIVESRLLTRHIDYSIDYLGGTLFFKQPVPSRDANFNPVFIVAEYEVLNGGKQEIAAGGRGSLKLANDRLEVGASYLHQGAAAGDAQVVGTDLRWQIDAATELKAEIARSESDDPTVAADAGAYLTEVTHATEKLDARAYVREQETGFGLGQQRVAETGTRKLGLDGRYKLTQTLSVEAEAYRQEVLTSGAQRELVSAGVQHENEDYTLGAGARHVADTGLASGDAESQSAFVNGSVDLFKDVITVRAAQDFTLGGKNESTDFPARSLLGLDYHWRADTTFFAEYEHANGATFDTDLTRLGVRTAPWERAQLQSSMNHEVGEYGPRVFASAGLTQGWQLNERWGFDFGVDQSKTVSGSSPQPLNANVPLASGTAGIAGSTGNFGSQSLISDDFLATFVGALYRSELWTFTSRLENRAADREDRWVFAGGFYREPIGGHAFSLATQWFDSDFDGGSDTTAGEIQFAWAFRPVTSEWIVLNRLDLKQDSRSDVLGEFESARLVDNLNSNWQLDVRTQLGLQFGGRYVRSTFDGERYSGLSMLYGVDLRRDLNRLFDCGIHGTMLSSLQSDVSDASVGIDVGVTVARNVWISLGYNFAGFRDADFEASRYTAQGPFIKFRMKADQDTFKDLSLSALRAKK